MTALAAAAQADPSLSWPDAIVLVALIAAFAYLFGRML
jgi:hypothetical protein